MLLKCLSTQDLTRKSKMDGDGGFRKKYKLLLFIHGFPHKSARIWILVLKFLNGHFSSDQFDLYMFFQEFFANSLQLHLIHSHIEVVIISELPFNISSNCTIIFVNNHKNVASSPRYSSSCSPK